MARSIAALSSWGEIVGWDKFKFGDTWALGLLDQWGRVNTIPVAKHWEIL